MITLGDFTILRMGDGKIWIRHESGEGGQFDEEKVAEVIAKFYKENF